MPEGPTTLLTRQSDSPQGPSDPTDSQRDPLTHYRASNYSPKDTTGSPEGPSDPAEGTLIHHWPPLSTDPPKGPTDSPLGPTDSPQLGPTDPPVLTHKRVPVDSPEGPTDQPESDGLLTH